MYDFFICYQIGGNKNSLVFNFEVEVSDKQIKSS